jgi:hypothetical protein
MGTTRSSAITPTSTRATVGTAGGDDDLDGGAGDDALRAGPADAALDGGGNADDCDGEAGTRDTAKRCEIAAGIP